MLVCFWAGRDEVQGASQTVARDACVCSGAGPIYDPVQFQALCFRNDHRSMARAGSDPSNPW